MIRKTLYARTSQERLGDDKKDALPHKKGLGMIRKTLMPGPHKKGLGMIRKTLYARTSQERLGDDKKDALCQDLTRKAWG